VPKQRSKETKTMIHLLENLAAAVAQAVDGGQVHAAR
jgi:hypothetical protein